MSGTGSVEAVTPLDPEVIDEAAQIASQYSPLGG
jgi:hypothetical protein